MDKSNTKDKRNTKRSLKQPTLHATVTPTPKWSMRSDSGMPTEGNEGRKLYLLLALWGILLTVAVAAATSDTCDGTAAKVQSVPEAFRHAEASSSPQNGAAQHTSCRRLDIDTTQLNMSWPKNFTHTKEATISHAEWLAPAVRILLEGQRPLRVLQIGDSHVAGKSFPAALKEALQASLGTASSADEGKGVWFSYVGSNGATSSRFLTDDYMERFAQCRPDLIVLSLGTNEAHGMGYREDIHNRQLDLFFDKLKEACPQAIVVMSTSPGDYLTTSYVNYRRTSRSSRRRVKVVRRSSRPNPMNARCAANIVAYGEAHGMPVWDLFSQCGGEDGTAQRNWVSAHLMRADRIHFEPEGYKVQGRLLGNALIRALARCEIEN